MEKSNDIEMENMANTQTETSHTHTQTHASATHDRSQRKSTVIDIRTTHRSLFRCCCCCKEWNKVRKLFERETVKHSFYQANITVQSNTFTPRCTICFKLYTHTHTHTVTSKSKTHVWLNEFEWLTLAPALLWVNTHKRFPFVQAAKENCKNRCNGILK